MMMIVTCAKDTVPASLVTNKSWTGIQEELDRFTRRAGQVYKKS